MATKEQIGRRTAVGVHALFALLFLGMLCTHELVTKVGGFTWPDLFRSFLPRFGILAILEASLLLVGRLLVGRLSRLFLPLVVLAHALLFIGGTLTHRYFLVTGSHLDWSLALYILDNAASLRSLAGAGIDEQLALYLGMGTLFLMLAGLWSRRRWARLTGSPLAAEAALLVLGAALWVGQTSTSLPPEHLLDRLLDGEEAGQRLFGRYEPPQVERSAPPSELPNVVFVILESFRADVVGAYNPYSPGSDTPVLDSFAAKGLVVEAAYAAVTHTSKALVGILCGGFPRLHTEIGEALWTGLPLVCLPRVLEQMGYRSRFLQSADNFENRLGLVENMGFDEWKLRDDLEGEDIGYLGKGEEAMIEPALQWAREAKEAGEPLFLSILTSASHHPYQIPGDVPIPPHRWGDEEAFDRYRRAVNYVDKVVGKIVEGLQGIEPNTLFIIVSDHGEAFGEHGPWGHNLVPFETGVRVPLILMGPDLPAAPGVVKGLRHHIDLVPTVLDYLSVKWEGEVPGLSLFDEEGHDYVVSSCWQTRRCIALRRGNLKFIHDYTPNGTRVYDLVEDPLETRDIAFQFPRAVIGAAEARLLRVQAEIDDQYFRADNTRGRK